MRLAAASPPLAQMQKCRLLKGQSKKVIAELAPQIEPEEPGEDAPIGAYLDHADLRATLRAEALHCHLRALPSTAEAISARFEVTYARPGKRTLRWPRGTAVSIQSG